MNFKNITYIICVRLTFPTEIILQKYIYIYFFFA